jgi:hypothetical protein
MPLMVGLPYRDGNKDWLRGDGRRRPRWQARYECWEVPAAWFDDLVRNLLLRFGQAYVVQPYRQMEKCAHACWNAKGFECECSYVCTIRRTTGPRF